MICNSRLLHCPLRLLNTVFLSSELFSMPRLNVLSCASNTTVFSVFSMRIQIILSSLCLQFSSFVTRRYHRCICGQEGFMFTLVSPPDCSTLLLSSVSRISVSIVFTGLIDIWKFGSKVLLLFRFHSSQELTQTSIRVDTVELPTQCLSHSWVPYLPCHLAISLIHGVSTIIHDLPQTRRCSVQLLLFLSSTVRRVHLPPGACSQWDPARPVKIMCGWCDVIVELVESCRLDMMSRLWFKI